MVAAAGLASPYVLVLVGLGFGSALVAISLFPTRASPTGMRDEAAINRVMRIGRGTRLAQVGYLIAAGATILIAL